MGVSIAAILLPLAGAVVMLLLPSRAMPADFLPADRTIALFSQIHEIDRFPMLKTVPFTNTTVAVAFLDLGSGAIAGVLFEPAPFPSTLPFAISVSDPRANMLLRNIQHPLSRDPSFRLLAPSKNFMRPWAYLHVPTFGTLFSLDRPVVYVPSKTGFDLSMGAKDAREYFSPLEMSPPRLFESPLFILHSSDAAAHFSLMTSFLNDEPSTVMESVLRTLLKATFGPDVSPAYDLLPLLEYETALHVAEDPRTHALQFVLIGSTAQSTEKSATIDRIFQSMTRELRTIRHVSRTFDDKYVFRGVAADESLLSRQSSLSGTWKIESVTQTETKQRVLLARSGNHFILSNAPDAFARALAINTSEVRDSLEPLPASVGLMERSSGEQFLKEHLPTLFAGHPLGTGTGKYIQWQLLRSGAKLTLRVKE